MSLEVLLQQKPWHHKFQTHWLLQILREIKYIDKHGLCAKIPQRGPLLLTLTDRK
jgi:hypothetical protein